MTAKSLENLRAEIDAIDDRLLALVMERMAITDAIKAAKAEAAAAAGIAETPTAFRPAREAQILRRILGRAGENAPRAAIAQIWRELVAASSQAQKAFTVAVSRDAPWTAQLARDHFGAATAYAAHGGAFGAWQAMVSGAAQFCVLPRPEAEDQWWRKLFGAGEDAPRLLARLPFFDGFKDEGRGDAFVFGCAPTESGGCDIALIGVDCAAELSRGRLRELLLEAGFSVEWLISDRADDDRRARHLAFVDGWLGEQQRHLREALQPLGEKVDAIAFLGGYARPIVERE